MQTGNHTVSKYTHAQIAPLVYVAHAWLERNFLILIQTTGRVYISVWEVGFIVLLRDQEVIATRQKPRWPGTKKRFTEKRNQSLI